MEISEVLMGILELLIGFQMEILMKLSKNLKFLGNRLKIFMGLSELVVADIISIWFGLSELLADLLVGIFLWYMNFLWCYQNFWWDYQLETFLSFKKLSVGKTVISWKIYRLIRTVWWCYHNFWLGNQLELLMELSENLIVSSEFKYFDWISIY